MGKVFNMVGGGGGAGSPDLPIGSRINVTSDIGATIDITKGSLHYTKKIGEDAQLPSGYTRVEYIESHGTEYIDSEINATQNIGIEFDGYTSGVDQAMFGVNANISVNDESGSLRYRWNNNNYTYSSSPRTRCVVKFNQGECYFNDTLVNTFTKGSFSTGHLYLFGRNNSGNLDWKMTGACYGIKIWDNNTLVRNYIPCYRNSDNIGGLFDLISNTFFTTSVGAFTYPTQGTVTFTVNYSGTWQLSASKSGEETLTDTVSVLADDTDYNVDMRFWFGTLYDAGNEYTNITGGWHSIGKAWESAHNVPNAPEITRNSASIKFKQTSSSYYSGIAKPTNLIDLTGFTKLKVNIVSASASGAGLIRFAVWDASNFNYVNNYVANVAINTGDTTKELDITSLSGEYYVGFGLYVTAEITVSKVYLE